MHPSQNSTEDAKLSQKLSATRVAKAIFFSFFGVRKRRDYESDSTRITLLQAIFGGIIGVVILVATLLLLVTVLIG